MKTRILLLDTGKEWGGGTNSMIELLKRIDRERFEVVALFYRDYPKGQASSLGRELAAIGIPLEIMPPAKQPLWAKISKELVKGLWRAFPAKRRQLLHAIELRWRIVPTAQRIAERLRDGGFDLLYMNNQPSSNLEGYLAAEMASLPVVQHCRSGTDLCPQETEIVNRIARRIVCVSEGIKDSLIAQGVRSDLCCVVHNAIDTNQRLPEPVRVARRTPAALVIGSVGSLMQRKSNDHLLLAAARLRERYAQDFCLVFVGDGPEMNNLKALAGALGLAPMTEFAGFQQQPLAWTAAMDVLALCSPREGLPRAVLEAMLLGKPVVASDVVGSRELVREGESGFLYPYGDIEALADRLQRLLEDPLLRRRMGEAGRQRILDDFSIDCYIAGVQGELEGASR